MYMMWCMVFVLICFFWGLQASSSSHFTWAAHDVHSSLGLSLLFAHYIHLGPLPRPTCDIGAFVWAVRLPVSCWRWLASFLLQISWYLTPSLFQNKSSSAASHLSLAMFPSKCTRLLVISSLHRCWALARDPDVIAVFNFLRICVPYCTVSSW